MKKIVLTFGTIAGILTAGMLFVTNPADMSSQDHSNSAILGYTTMIVALSTIFIAIKMYRDKHNGGTIKFGRAFLIGVYISLIASFLYATGWEIALSMNNIEPMTFMNQYVETEMAAMKAAGATAEAVAAKKSETLAAWGWYDNLILRFLWTMIGEMFIVGVIVSLIAAALLRKKEVLPAHS